MTSKKTIDEILERVYNLGVAMHDPEPKATYTMTTNEAKKELLTALEAVMPEGMIVDKNNSHKYVSDKHYRTEVQAYNQALSDVREALKEYMG